MVQGKFLSGQDDLTVIKEIRRQVFSEEPGLWEDELDGRCMHVLAMQEDQVVACGRICYDGFECEISRVAVLPAYQRQKFGDFVVRMLIDKALLSGVDEMRLEAPEEICGFFEKIGFRATGNTAHLEASEWKELILKKDQIHKCCGCHENGK